MRENTSEHWTDMRNWTSGSLVSKKLQNENARESANNVLRETYRDEGIIIK